MSKQPFADHQVVVTGGGTGIGRATAIAFAEQGAGVIIVGRRPEPLEKTAALHPALVPVVADIRTERGVETVAEAVADGPGRLDVLVNNAGIFRRTGLDGLDMAAVREVFEVNVFGPAQLTAKLLPWFDRPGGSVVLVSSVMGHLPGPGQFAYAASKAAVDSLTRSWAKELAGRRIRVNAIAPGTVETEALTAAALGVTEEQLAAVRAQKTRAFPLGRYGQVDDVTPWILRLAERANSWMTGQVITVDGGWDLGAPEGAALAATAATATGGER
ncbi:SDR family oxidoreductase [Actinoplanes sp. NPDC049548]|uniref:SDR family NAD(P)-dependent oxidoreductase n=1 Tax=Actinoplanes sp. NPDC049548 TaxID=3155152 RepID=UPI00341D7171